MVQVFLSIVPLFTLIIIGWVVGKMKVASTKWVDVLNAYAYYLGFPALIFYSLIHLQSNLSDYLTIIGLNIVYLLVLLIGTYALLMYFKMSASKRRTIPLLLVFNNIAFLGFPVIERTIGKLFLGEASIIAACYLFTVFSVGVFLLEATLDRQTSPLGILKSLLRNPLLVAVILGVAVQVLQIKLPASSVEVIEMIGSSTTPVVLCAIGVFMSTVTLKPIKNWLQPFIISLISLLIVPLCLWMILKSNLETTKLSIIEAAMPLAITPFAMAKNYQLDQNLIARSIVLSTLLSFITLPFWIDWLV